MIETMAFDTPGSGHGPGQGSTGTEQHGPTRPRWLTRLPWRTGEDWERPGPTREQQRHDIIGTIVLLLVSAFILEVSRGIGAVAGETKPIWLQHLAMALIILPLAVRRRYPVAVMLACSAVFLGLGLLVPSVSMQMTFQAAYFASLYTAVAWAKDRRMLWLGTTVVIAVMALWVILSFTVSSSYDSVLERIMEGDDTYRGFLPPLVSLAIYNFAINAAYFGGAIMFGMNAWRSAHQRELLLTQSAQLEVQAAELARQAVLDERLRIARELHDVVAHHIAVIGVQAGAARRVLEKKPGAAAGALQTIEGSSREAVEQMRSLLGVLRSGEQPGSESDGGARRAPEPGLADLPALVAEHGQLGLSVSYHRSEDVPGALDRVPAPMGLSIYRTVQESLANVRRHSTAGSAVVALRTGTTGEGRAWVEVETVDDGRPRTGSTAGSGFGIRGIRERADLHGGIAEIGPRSGGGWRVRVRFPVR
ncbi:MULTISPECIES: sensor histidine kinase [unclassified Arthrobacter]|uniref:sensor histidine kinase n=1 Tax=unclassified Arthrobacter TaxID=235627 RepID=UPI001E61072D|nr:MULTISPECIES: sensor histidine kinase [unclassified Arthrobacter]MCC9144589.1 sensor histidine kinase [Arthrobacter sp. zg-Y919]MDK1275815.1 sensor histidine kinase [Arthrobacter sp. zg.Y919]WIB02821.1 sensor histidine kinase [Arthrobacter sp. zg-Y919]